jgi:hypothetical protein
MSSRKSFWYFGESKPCSRELFWLGVRARVRTCRSSGWVAMEASNRYERKGPPLSVTMVTSGCAVPSVSRGARSSSGLPACTSASRMVSSIAAIASCWFAVGETCRPSSYFGR